MLRRLEQRGHEACLIDTSTFPTRSSIALGISAHNASDDEVRFGVSELRDARAVWWRRPQPIALHDEVGESAARFTFGECLAGLSGLWAMFDAAWMNVPSRDEEANRKPYQLRIARSVGLTIPRTLITSDPAAAERFARELGPGNVIYKAFTATERAWRETRRLRDEELDLLRSVRFAPVIFQALVEAELDVRVTVVGDTIFATAVRLRPDDYRYDYRVGLSDATVQAHELPAAVIERVRRLMAELGLVYGALDFRRTRDGQYVFLEVNPSGQWLFMEDRSGSRSPRPSWTGSCATTSRARARRSVSALPSRR